jgi:hypothetical protein
VTKRFDATERLTGYVDATEITTFGGKEVLDGVTSRDGHFADSSQSELFGLTGENFDQRAEPPGIPGRFSPGAAVAVMPDASGGGYWLVTQTGHVYTFR